MIDIWGLEGMMSAEADQTARERGDADLLNGPARPGYGLDQSDIDIVMAPAAAVASPDRAERDLVQDEQEFAAEEDDAPADEQIVGGEEWIEAAQEDESVDQDKLEAHATPLAPPASSPLGVDENEPAALAMPAAPTPESDEGREAEQDDEPELAVEPWLGSLDTAAEPTSLTDPSAGGDRADGKTERAGQPLVPEEDLQAVGPARPVPLAEPPAQDMDLVELGPDAAPAVPVLEPADSTEAAPREADPLEPGPSEQEAVPPYEGDVPEPAEASASASEASQQVNTMDRVRAAIARLEALSVEEKIALFS